MKRRDADVVVVGVCVSFFLVLLMCSINQVNLMRNRDQPTAAGWVDEAFFPSSFQTFAAAVLFHVVGLFCPLSPAEASPLLNLFLCTLADASHTRRCR